MKALSIYIHIPFCIKKCNYCDFLSAPAERKQQEDYVLALLKEIEYYGKRYKDVPIKSIYFGGGTPSILPEKLMMEILCKLKQAFPGIAAQTAQERVKEGFTETEISIELNPGTVTKEKLKAYRQAGINRLSIGLQSADNEELRLLGRIHTYEEFLETYQAARKQGFSNMNIDLISALPMQKLESWQETLKKVLALRPEHISAYSLMLEEGTPFYETYAKHKELLPDEETDRAMYALTKKLLHRAGYERYEISNYSKKNMECKHNLVYWQRENYLGMGLGSSSMIENVRFKNSDKIKDYVNFWITEAKEILSQQSPNLLPTICEDIQSLTIEEQMEEFMFLGLRMIKGISIKEFQESFGKSIFEVYGKQIETLKRQGVLQVTDRIFLTDRGLDVSNMILAEFLLG